MRAVGGTAGGAGKQPRDKTQFGVPQALGAGRALAPELDARLAPSIGSHAALETHLAPIQLRLGATDGKAAFAEIQRAGGARQQGRIRADAHIVAAEGHGAADGGGGQPVERQPQAELHVGRSAHLGLRQGLAGHGIERGLAHEVQHLVGWPLRTGADHQCGGVGQVGDLDAGFAEPHIGRTIQPGAHAAELERGPVQQQLTLHILERRPGHLARDLQEARHIGEVHPAQLGRDAEIAHRAGQVERRVPEVTLDAERHLVGGATAHRFPHIAAHLRAQAQRQIAVHPAGVGAGEGGVQIEHAGKAGFRGAGRRIAGVPPGLCRALCVGIGQAHVVQPGLDALAHDLPGSVGGQALQRQADLFKHTGQVQRAVLHLHTGLAARLVEFEIHRGAPDAGPTGHRVIPKGRLLTTVLAGQGQPNQPTLGLVAARAPVGPSARGSAIRRRWRALPAGAKTFHLASRLQAVQQGMGGAGQRQVGGDGRQRGEVDAVGRQCRRSRLAALASAVLQRQVSAGPDLPGAGAESQVVGGHAEALFAPMGAQAALQVIDHQRGQLGAELDVDRPQREVGGDAGHAPFVDLQPSARSTLAGAHVHRPGRQVHMGSQTRHIGAR